MQFPNAAAVMRHALQLAARAEGHVEPNPQVGAVIVDDALNCLGTGYHQLFGGPHAEVHALREAGETARGATLFVTLEPCCHTGKTPPCSQAVIAAGIKRVVVGCVDPFPKVVGGGIAQLRAAGIKVEVGCLEVEAQALIAPFRKLVTTGLPYVHAKWAMSCDGKIAARTGISRWISSAESRQVVHELRGRMDGILVGIGTALADDPLLTVRPPGLRTPLRIVLDSQARLPVTAQLATTAHDAPVLLFTTDSAPAERRQALSACGIEVLILESDGHGRPLLPNVLRELGSRKLTNLLIEGGSEILGACVDQQLLDEVHIFIAPKLIGGRAAPGPVGGVGLSAPPELPQIESWTSTSVGPDVYLRGRLRK